MGAVLAAAAVKYPPVRLELAAFKAWVTTALVRNCPSRAPAEQCCGAILMRDAGSGVLVSATTWCRRRRPSVTPFPAAEAGCFRWSLVPTAVSPYSHVMMREQHCQTLLMRCRPRRAGGHGADGGGCEVHLPVRLELAALAALWRHVLRDRSCCCGGRLEGGACPSSTALLLVLDAESNCVLLHGAAGPERQIADSRRVG